MEKQIDFGGPLHIKYKVLMTFTFPELVVLMLRSSITDHQKLIFLAPPFWLRVADELFFFFFEEAEVLESYQNIFKLAINR